EDDEVGKSAADVDPDAQRHVLDPRAPRVVGVASGALVPIAGRDRGRSGRRRKSPNKRGGIIGVAFGTAQARGTRRGALDRSVDRGNSDSSPTFGSTAGGEGARGRSDYARRRIHPCAALSRRESSVPAVRYSFLIWANLSSVNRG